MKINLLEKSGDMIISLECLEYQQTPTHHVILIEDSEELSRFLTSMEAIRVSILNHCCDYYIVVVNKEDVDVEVFDNPLLEETCEMMRTFVEKHGCFPLYLRCIISFKGSIESDVVNIAFEQEGDIPESCILPDEKIFFTTKYENLHELFNVNNSEDFYISGLCEVHGESYDKETILDYLFDEISKDELTDMFNTHFQTNRICNELMELIDEEELLQFFRVKYADEFSEKELFDIATDNGFPSDECEDWILEDWNLKQ